jgi:hypothetical protein
MLYVRHMIRTQVYLTEDQYNKIKVIAQEEQKPAAKVLREAVNKGLRGKKAKTAGQALLELAEWGENLDIKGLPKDLSTNHDYYLYEEE